MSKKKRARVDVETGFPGARPPLGAQLDLAVPADVEQGRLVIEHRSNQESAAGIVEFGSEAVPAEAVAEAGSAAIEQARAVQPDAPVEEVVLAPSLARQPELAIDLPLIAQREPEDVYGLPATQDAHLDAADELPPVTVEIPPSLSQRLRAAREAKGLSREEMARRMRVSPSVIQDIENDQWQRLGATVYVRGHLTSYARSLDVPTVVVHHALRDIEAPVQLALTVAAVPSSAWRRFASGATYVVLTLLLAIPVFNLIPKRGVNSPVPQVRLMDESELGASSIPYSTQQPAEVGDSDETMGPPSSLASDPTTALVEQTPPATAPLMASMTPMRNSTYAETSDQHRIEMSFSQDSWLEVMDASGARIDYGMARAGERRVHLARGPVTMIVGNANGAQLRVDGKPVALAPFARLNVARLRLFEAEPTSSAPSR